MVSSFYSRPESTSSSQPDGVHVESINTTLPSAGSAGQQRRRCAFQRAPLLLEYLNFLGLHTLRHDTPGQCFLSIQESSHCGDFI